MYADLDFHSLKDSTQLLQGREVLLTVSQGILPLPVAVLTLSGRWLCRRVR